MPDLRDRARLILAALLSTAACDAGTDARDVVVRDSAGIQIVESPTGLADSTYDRRLEADPILDIGVVEGAPEYQLFRVTSAQLLPDSRLVVANGGTQELRFFDMEGRFLYAVGGQGGGPGEYELPLLLPSPEADTIVVYDVFARRFTTLTMDGSLVRTTTPTSSLGTAVALIADQRLVTNSNTARIGVDSPEGVVTNEVLVRVIQLEPPGDDTIARFEGPDLFAWNQNGRVGFTQVPFDASPTVTAGAGRIHVALGRVPEVHTFDADGRLQRIVRIAHPRTPITRAQFDSYVAAQVARARDDAEAIEVRRRYAQTPMRDALPAHQRALVDAAGNVWLERYREDAAAAPRWTVIDSAGKPRGTITLSAGVRILTIGEDLVVGTVRDEVDVEHVIVWRLVPRGT
jgi:hypothetical protein